MHDRDVVNEIFFFSKEDGSLRSFGKMALSHTYTHTISLSLFRGRVETPTNPSFPGPYINLSHVSCAYRSLQHCTCQPLRVKVWIVPRAGDRLNSSTWSRNSGAAGHPIEGIASSGPSSSKCYRRCHCCCCSVRPCSCCKCYAEVAITETLTWPPPPPPSTTDAWVFIACLRLPACREVPHGLCLISLS